jgi:hypothetical protein
MVQNTMRNVGDEITDEELDYYKGKWLRISPEERYNRLKRDWYRHESSWYARKLMLMIKWVAINFQDVVQNVVTF